MSEKLFHTTNDEALISNVYFDTQFSEKREQWKQLRSGGWKIPETAKKALNDSIVVLAGVEKNCYIAVNSQDAAKIEDLGTDGTHVWER